MKRIKSKSGRFIALVGAKNQNYSVCVTAAAVEAFCDSWPCSRLPHHQPIRFEFQPNGDLVDIDNSFWWKGGFGTGTGCDYDGEDLLALSQDASNFGGRMYDKYAK